MLYIFHVNNGDGMLTYAFNSSSWGRASNDGLGVATFIEAMKAYYKNHTKPCSMSVLQDNGLFYNPDTKEYIPLGNTYNPHINIPLNKLAEKIHSKHLQEDANGEKARAAQSARQAAIEKTLRLAVSEQMETGSHCPNWFPEAVKVLDG